MLSYWKESKRLSEQGAIPRGRGSDQNPTVRDGTVETSKGPCCF